MMQRLRKALAAIVLAPLTALTLSGFGLGDIGNVLSGPTEHQYTWWDLGLGFLVTGNLASMATVSVFGQLMGADAGTFRRRLDRVDSTVFYSEYDIVGKEPVKYNQVGKNDLDNFLRESAKVTAAAQAGRKLVSRITANLIKMNQTAAIGAQLKQSEQDLTSADDETQAQVRDKILAKLKEKRAALEAKHQEAIFRMNVASTGATICAVNATTGIALALAAIPGAGKDIADLVTNPSPALVSFANGAKNQIDNIQKLSKDLPAFKKNSDVLRAALAELSSQQ